MLGEDSGENSEIRSLLFILCCSTFWKCGDKDVVVWSEANYFVCEISGESERERERERAKRRFIDASIPGSVDCRLQI
jgi:hypothetical protein